jgi:hypothetical protein
VSISDILGNVYRTKPHPNPTALSPAAVTKTAANSGRTAGGLAVLSIPAPLAAQDFCRERDTVR